MPNKTENYRFGLSTLHAWIRFFEYCLHLAYRLEFKTWQVRAINKKAFNNRKQLIQNKIRSELGLLVDVVLQGHGTTNDGNTARKFFRNAEISANCTGLNVELIQQCGNILSAMASGMTINIDYFEEYCLKTAKMFVTLYPWYYMPRVCIKCKVSEEAQESRNKDYKQYREHNTRKNSRLNTNEDLLHILLISSDPYISSIRNVSKQNEHELSDDVKKLLIIPESDEDEESDINQSFSEITLTD
ncbi:hypothetical protein AGLY_017283 [Aphis glycines]|uniref:Uncharacterized protein n=1 Tax=Aphis glycines TaxID=307491 RepID=A0A6G0SXF1_APHGL|nr:hypothetical protein AGLY_017283 [Aphis glycines]